VDTLPKELPVKWRRFSRRESRRVIKSVTIRRISEASYCRDLYDAAAEADANRVSD
jgi:hypothetical protein